MIKNKNEKDDKCFLNDIDLADLSTFLEVQNNELEKTEKKSKFVIC